MQKDRVVGVQVLTAEAQAVMLPSGGDECWTEVLDRHGASDPGRGVVAIDAQIEALFDAHAAEPLPPRIADLTASLAAALAVPGKEGGSA